MMQRATIMGLRGLGRAGVPGLLLALAAAAPFPVLDRLEPGLWQLSGSENREIARICLGDPAQFVQIEHRGQACQRSLLGSADRSVTIRYTCPRTGFGRTTILVETPRLAQLDSQGLLNGAPFALHAEARKIGPCPAAQQR
jgi:hypothetical protein